MKSNITFNPQNAYWEQAIQAQLDQQAENPFPGAVTYMAAYPADESLYDYDALADAFADLPEEDETDG